MTNILRIPVFVLGIISLSLQANAQVIVRFAGDTVLGHTGDGGPATGAELNQPFSLLRDAAGNVYIGEGNGADIRMVSPGGTITTFAGSGTAGFSGDGGPATAARLNGVSGMAFDPSGNMIIADFGNNCIRKINMTSHIITTIAGTGGASGSTGDGGPASAALFNHPMCVRTDASGNIYISDWSNNKIRMIDTTDTVRLVAGTGTAGYSGGGGPATAAELHSPYKLVLDAAGDIYFSDGGNNCVRKIHAGTGIITTIAGSGSSGFSGDGGPATAAVLSLPVGLAFDYSSRLLIADRGNGRIRAINSSGNINTIAGTGGAAETGDGGPATAATFNSPFDIMVDPNNNIFIGDINGHTVREIIAAPVAAFTAPGTLCSDSCTTLSSNGMGSLDSVTWSIAGMTLTSPHSTTITPCFTAAGSYTVTLNVYNVSGSDSHNTTITVNQTPHPHVTGGMSASVPAVYSSYQWYRIGTGLISGATSNSYFGPTGAYYVVVDSGGCIGRSDTAYVGEGVPVVNQQSNRFWLSQTAGNATLYSSEPLAEPVSVTVCDLAGRTLFAQQWSRGSSEKLLPVASFTPGLYIVTLSNDALRQVLKWGKQ